MELPVFLLFEDVVKNVKLLNAKQTIRLLEIDGVYLASRISIALPSYSLINIDEVAFDSEEQAQKYMSEEWSVDFPESLPEKGNWRDEIYD